MHAFSFLVVSVIAMPALSEQTLTLAGHFDKTDSRFEDTAGLLAKSNSSCVFQFSTDGDTTKIIASFGEEVQLYEFPTSWIGVQNGELQMTKEFNHNGYLEPRKRVKISGKWYTPYIIPQHPPEGTYFRLGSDSDERILTDFSFPLHQGHGIPQRINFYESLPIRGTEIKVDEPGTKVDLVMINKLSTTCEVDQMR